MPDTTETKTPETNSPDTANASASSDGDGEESEDKKTRTSRKVYIIIGEIKEFASVKEAEKYLNTDDAPSEFEVIKGNLVEKKQKVTLK